MTQPSPKDVPRSDEAKLRISPYSKAVFERSNSPKRMGIFGGYKVAMNIIFWGAPLLYFYIRYQHGKHAAPFVYYNPPTPTTTSQQQFNKFF